MADQGERSRPDAWRRGIQLGLITFVASLFVALPSQVLVRELTVPIAFFILLVIVGIAVVSDVIGVAAAAAVEPPFHAMAAKRMPGARQALYLVRNSERVNAIFADMIGDLAGTVAGGAGAAIAFRLFESGLFETLSIPEMILLGLTASLMVGGKAFAKEIAIRRSVSIIHTVGQLMARVEALSGRVFFEPVKSKKGEPKGEP